MKINAKLFLLAFTIITLVSVTSAFIYNTLAQQLIHKQQSKVIVNSANDFIFVFQQLIQKVDEEYQKNLKGNETIPENRNVDFVFETLNDSSIVKSSFRIKEGVNIYKDVSRLSEFIVYNSNLIVRHDQNRSRDIYYGIRINAEIIKDLSEKIRADIALVENNVVSKFTNAEDYNYYLPNLSTAARELKDKNNFEILYNTLGEEELTATHVSPKVSDITNKAIDFIIFSISAEASSFKSTMSLVTLVIVLSGISLTIIFLFLFTTKFRRQLDFISEGVNDIASGERNKRVRIITTDEIGTLGTAFNNMLDELDKRDFEEKEYAEFISIINQNSSLEEVGDATLKKIINYTGADVGAFYLYKNLEFIPFAVVGLVNKKQDLFVESGIYNKAKEQKEIIELSFEENHPVVKTGLTEFRINYLHILPIFYNNELIAIMELASVNKPKVNIKYYLNKIKDQLAIGLANGKVLSELRTLVDELKNLNKAYQEQNIEITEKNEQLVRLHDELKKGSKELEVQTAKAVESEKIKSQFLANMSHELRTPQNSILGLTELILKDETTSVKTRERLNVVLRNGKKLLTLIENILEYSKLESGNTEIQKSHINLDELIDEVQSFIQPLFIGSNIDFKLDVPKDYTYKLNTDVKKIEQIIYNLIGNAIKFTSDGYVKLQISCHQNDLEIIVEDTGQGISDDDQKIIFDEFRQVDANLNRKFSGSGLGLAICKRYAELLSGDIELNSIPNKGSLFKINIPDVVESKSAVKVKKQTSVKESSSLNSFIVSEGRDAISLISDYLITHKINVNVFTPEEAGINKISEVKPDILILDVLFQNRSGWNLLFEVKSNPVLKNMPVVLVNMDEEANCGLGLKVFKYCSDVLNRKNILENIEAIKNNQSIEFKKLHIIMNSAEFNLLNSDMSNDDLQLSHSGHSSDHLLMIKRNEPDVIFIDLFNPEINTFNILAEIGNNLATKDIPVISFIKETDTLESEQLNNTLLETTLLKQYHPLDVLKVIKDSMELYYDSAFVLENETSHVEEITVKDSYPNKVVNTKIKVLIVDDDSDARFTIGEIIKSLDYEPIFATNGFDCLEKLKAETPNLILLDIMMPKMDGFQTIKKIRENDQFKDLDVYALTAYAMLSDKDIIEKNGFDGLITKPINTVQLERKLSNIFNTVH